MFIDDKQVGQGRIEHTIPARFSLDETFDVGADTGTPVVLEYQNKMPFTFTGITNKFTLTLDPQQLTDEQRKSLMKNEADTNMVGQ